MDDVINALLFCGAVNCAVKLDNSILLVDADVVVTFWLRLAEVKVAFTAVKGVTEELFENTTVTVW